MLNLPCTFDDPQVLGDEFAFELIDETRHRYWLESIMGRARTDKALEGWNFADWNGPDKFRFTRVIKRLSDNQYVCYMESALVKLTETSWRVMNAGRFMPKDLRDRGELTKAIADEHFDYIFNRFPIYVEEFSLELPIGMDINKRTPIPPSAVMEGDKYTSMIFTREDYLNSFY